MLRDPEGFRQTLRPACRRCTARYGITGPVACHLPPHLTVCRRHQLWIGPAARSHAAQLDVSPFPEVLRAQRRHLALVHQHDWWQVDTAISHATLAIHRVLRDGGWTPPQPSPQLGPGAWHQAHPGMPSIGPGRHDDGPGHLAVEIAIYPDVVRLAARSLRAHNTSQRAAP